MLFYIIAAVLIAVFILYLISILPDFSRRARLRSYAGLSFAHRGLHNADRLIPENSMSAFKEAVRHKLAIELDIHLTQDLQVVVFHDELLKRVCNVPGTVEDFTYAELQKFHLLNTDERIPLFTEVLDYVDGRVPILIELKLPAKDMSLCPYAAKILHGYHGPYMVQSFNSLGIRWFRQNDPSVLRGQLSSALTKSRNGTPYPVRFCVQHLLTNLLCRPDFISYKLKDARNLSVWINHKLLRTPTAVWTLRDAKACRQARAKYDMYIFEHEENLEYLSDVSQNKQKNL